MMADHPRNLGRFGKLETLLAFPICRRQSQTIGDVYNLEFFNLLEKSERLEKSEIPVDHACGNFPTYEKQP